MDGMMNLSMVYFFRKPASVRQEKNNRQPGSANLTRLK